MKKYLIGFILGAIIFGGIGTVLAYSVFARNIGFTPTDTTWKKSNGDNIDNVEDALNELYTSTFKKVVLNTFGNPLYNAHFGTLSTTTYSASQTVNKGKYMVFAVYSAGASNNSSNVDTELQ